MKQHKINIPQSTDLELFDKLIEVLKEEINQKILKEWVHMENLTENTE